MGTEAGRGARATAIGRSAGRPRWAAVAVVLVLIPACGGGDDAAEPSARATSPQAVVAPSPSPSKPPLTPAQAFERTVRKKLGKSNRDVTRVESVTYANGLAQVRWAINENLTEGSTKTGARLDGIEMLKAAKKLPGLREVSLIGTYSLQNDLGEVSEEVVVNVLYSADVVSRVKLENIDSKKLYDLADLKAFVHPSFRY